MRHGYISIAAPFTARWQRKRCGLCNIMTRCTIAGNICGGIHFLTSNTQVLSCTSKLLLAHAVRSLTGCIPADIMRSDSMATSPPALRFAYGLHGQPQLLPSLEDLPRLYMSLSHHSNVIAVALAATPVGVDVVDVQQLIPGIVNIQKGPVVAMPDYSSLDADVHLIFAQATSLTFSKMRCIPLRCSGCGYTCSRDVSHASCYSSTFLCRACRIRCFFRNFSHCGLSRSALQK
jgi:hypothetical protein